MTIALIGIGLLRTEPVQAGEWDPYYDAERSAKDLLFSYEHFLKMGKGEIEKLVAAICDAEEEDRQAVSSEAGRNTRDKVRSEYDKVERRKNEAVSLLDKALANNLFKEKHGDARNLKTQVEDRWKSIHKMGENILRGSNHPVVAFMAEKGKEEHNYRQGRCTVKEFNTGGRKAADCIGYDGNACLIVEFKPDNQRGIRKGRAQVNGYVSDIANNQSRREDLNSKSSSFQSCQKFEGRVDCYKLCPQIDGEGNYRGTSATWRTGCN